MLDPHTDWRVVANAVRNWPKCKNCGEPYGNMAFGSAHYVGEGIRSTPVEGITVTIGGCIGYQPATELPE